MKSIIFEDALQELFTDMHRSGLFSDGKEISDAELNYPPDEILGNYRQQKDRPEFDLSSFYHSHFSRAPQRATSYRSNTDLSVEDHINKLWDVLTRQPEKATRHSTLIPLPHPYIVPGGRFNEIYYWDSYFTMLGLQVSGRTDMIENMIDNFTWLIDRYGFIPNGNRTYFLGRSQPPFYALMVTLLAEEKGDEVYKKYLPALEKEYAFWMDEMEGATDPEKRAIKRVVHYKETEMLNRYFDNISSPRTEMYSDDVELIEEHGDNAHSLILDIRAACESGWDFSSRWCAIPDQLSTLHTTEIVPVDLNCLLHFLEKTIAKASRMNGESDKADLYTSLASDRKLRINELFWNPRTRYYHDFDFADRNLTESISLAGLFPLFFEIAGEEQAAQCAKMIETAFLASGGLITTTYDTGQQWDAPNGWAPLQWIAIKGLRNYGYDELAQKIKERWTALNIKVYRNTGKLMEKYNVVNTDLESGGGEYPVQDGFGWTNGVLLRLLSE